MSDRTMIKLVQLKVHPGGLIINNFVPPYNKLLLTYNICTCTFKAFKYTYTHFNNPCKMFCTHTKVSSTGKCNSFFISCLLRSHFFRTNKIFLWVKREQEIAWKPFVSQFIFKVTHFYFTHNSTFRRLAPCTHFGDTLAMSKVQRRD